MYNDAIENPFGGVIVIFPTWTKNMLQRNSEKKEG